MRISQMVVTSYDIKKGSEIVTANLVHCRNSQVVERSIQPGQKETMYSYWARGIMVCLLTFREGHFFISLHYGFKAWSQPRTPTLFLIRSNMRRIHIQITATSEFPIFASCNSCHLCTSAIVPVTPWRYLRFFPWGSSTFQSTESNSATWSELRAKRGELSADWPWTLQVTHIHLVNLSHMCRNARIIIPSLKLTSNHHFSGAMSVFYQLDFSHFSSFAPTKTGEGLGILLWKEHNRSFRGITNHLFTQRKGP